jgi:hypothetical protein
MMRKDKYILGKWFGAMGESWPGGEEKGGRGRIQVVSCFVATKGLRQILQA